VRFRSLTADDPRFRGGDNSDYSDIRSTDTSGCDANARKPAAIVANVPFVTAPIGREGSRIIRNAGVDNSNVTATPATSDAIAIVTTIVTDSERGKEAGDAPNTAVDNSSVTAPAARGALGDKSDDSDNSLQPEVDRVLDAKSCNAADR